MYQASGIDDSYEATLEQLEADYAARMADDDGRDGIVSVPWSDGEGDPEPKPPTAGALKYPGFLRMSDDELIAVVADPFVLPGESAEEIVAEASAELARRMEAQAGRAA